MATTSAATATMPFAEEQLAPLRRLLAGASAEQRHWLAGYIAGFQAANEPEVAPAAPPSAKTPLTILYATESGNAETLAANAKREAGKLGFAARVLDMADVTPEQIADARNLLVIASTWGEGDPPQRAESFFNALMGEGAPRYTDLRYAVLALGDRAYAQFCETGKRIDARLAELGAARVAPVQECDLDFDAPAQAWIGTRLRELGAESAASVIHVDFMRAVANETAYSRARPFAAEITELLNLNSSRSTSRTFHMELSLEGSGLAYEPGDSLGLLAGNDPALVDEVLRITGLDHDDALRAALTEQYEITTLTHPQIAAYASLVGDADLAAIGASATQSAAFRADRQFIDLLAAAPHRLGAEQLIALLRPLAPRLYSVASSRRLVGEAAHLLVGEVAWRSHGRERRGVASGEVAARRRVGESARVYVQANRHFRLPQEAERPIIMIGPGTGVAPFRAFMQESEALGSHRRSWLVFGARNFTHDFLYQLEWQEWLKSGMLSRMDVAFSRDQPEKIYVQTRLWEARRDLYAWLQEGAVLYVCGDASAMVKDVHATLARIVADQSGQSEEAGSEYLRTLVQTGRYKRDVY